MELLRPSVLTSENLSAAQNGIPLIICTDAPRVQKKIEDAGYMEVQLNTMLSKKLMEYPQGERPKHVEKVLKSILNYDAPIFITHFEMLFDPRYKIDIIKFFCEKSRIINVAVKWPGKYNDGQLTYADPEEPDYHEYNCGAYQLRIVR